MCRELKRQPLAPTHVARYTGDMLLLPETTGQSEVVTSTRTPRLWCHPHVAGALVVEEASGQLMLVFERYRGAAWRRRVAWRAGMGMLLPIPGDGSALLARIGYDREP